MCVQTVILFCCRGTLNFHMTPQLTHPGVVPKPILWVYFLLLGLFLFRKILNLDPLSLFPSFPSPPFSFPLLYILCTDFPLWVWAFISLFTSNLKFTVFFFTPFIPLVCIIRVLFALVNLYVFVGHGKIHIQVATSSYGRVSQPWCP